MKHYIILGIIACCLIVSFNIHPNEKEADIPEMIYVFHDYERNQYIINNSSHGSSDELEFLFNDSVPENIKGEHHASDQSDTTFDETATNNIYDNQISIENIMNELGIDDSYSGNIIILDNNRNTSGIKENELVIDLSKDIKENQEESDNLYYVTKNGSTLTIRKTKNIINYNNNYLSNNNPNEKGASIKSFKTISETRVLPSLISLNQLQYLKNSNYTLYSDESDSFTNNSENYEDSKNIGGINILPDYADCMTPRGYKISHGESILAYKQVDSAPNVCNIERRFCRNGKLSGTYPQQGCSTNENYTYTQWNDLENSTKTVSTNSKSRENTDSQKSFTVNEDPTIELNTKQNKDGSVTVYKPETTGSFVFDKPSQTSTNIYRGEDNIEESVGVEQTKKEHINCITPRGEEVLHGQMVQAFKHANGFYDIPCETQIRLCSMGKLDGSYSQKSCKHWESSFIDRFNGSANNDKYYKEKLQKIRQKIKYEEEYYKEIKGLSEEEALDKIFYLLDE